MNRFLLATLALASACLPAPARQPAKPDAKPAQAQKAPDPKDWGVRLAADPIHAESVGVTMSIPVGSGVEQAAYQKIASTKIVLPDGLGLVLLQERRTKQLDLTTEKVADEILTELLALAPNFGWEIPDDQKDKPLSRDPDDIRVVGSGARLIQRDKAKMVGGYAADHAYVMIPRSGTEEVTIRGATLIKTGPGRFILLELYTTGSNYKKAREMYEVMLATAKIDDPTEAAERRAASIGMGERIMARLTESDYRELFSNMPERWERLYKEAPTGASSDEEEIGYRRIRARLGHRGDMSPEKPRDLWNADENAEGYLVQIDARLLDLGGVIDTRATYFLSPDFNEETWIVNMAIRHGPDEYGTPGKTSRWQEVGARRGQDMSVRIVPESSASTKIRPQIGDQGYISMVQSFVLPQLLVRAGIVGDFAFYSYQTTSGTVRLRTDSLDQSDSGRKLWTLTTHLNADAEPQVTTITPEGEVLRTTFADGRKWETVPLDQLVRIWKSKGLPLD
jgi:hypothetical protein